MKPDQSLKTVERQAYTATFQDGIYDLFWAAFFLICAWIPIMEALGISRFYLYPSFIIPLLIVRLGKKYVTIPRMGMVEFGSKRKNRRRLIALVGAATIILMLPLIILMIASGVSAGMGWMFVALIAIPLFAIAVVSLDFSRMYVYAGLLIFAVIESEVLLRYISQPWASLISFGIPGAAITVFGVSLLVKFLASHPKPNAEMTHVNR
jgi:hypothetical protein